MYKLTLLLFLGLLIGCEKTENPPIKEDSKIPVQASYPILSDVFLHLELMGTLHPWVSAPLYPQSEGTVEEIFIQDGASVKAGTPLFQIDPKPYLLKKKEALAQIAIDQAALAAVIRKLDRFNRLKDKDLIAESEWDRHKTEAEKTEGTLELDLARLERISLDLDRCQVTSPIDGRIGKINASKGQLVSSKQPLATVLQMDPLFVEFALTEKELEQLGDQTKFTINGVNETGIITFVDNRFDPKTGLVLLRGKISNTDLHLRPGQFVQVKIPVERKKNALSIPQKAVKRKADGAFVYLIGPDFTAIQQPVVLGEEIGKNVLVIEGLKPSDNVIIEGHLRLHPGVKVKL